MGYRRGPWWAREMDWVRRRSRTTMKKHHLVGISLHFFPSNFSRKSKYFMTCHKGFWALTAPFMYFLLLEVFQESWTQTGARINTSGWHLWENAWTCKQTTSYSIYIWFKHKFQAHGTVTLKYSQFQSGLVAQVFCNCCRYCRVIITSNRVQKNLLYQPLEDLWDEMIVCIFIFIFTGYCIYPSIMAVQCTLTQPFSDIIRPLSEVQFTVIFPCYWGEGVKGWEVDRVWTAGKPCRSTTSGHGLLLLCAPEGSTGALSGSLDWDHLGKRLRSVGARWCDDILLGLFQ